MKSEWKMPFDAVGFRFAKVHKYDGCIHEKIEVSGQAHSDLRFGVRIEPDRATSEDSDKQKGWLFITVPLAPDDSCEQLVLTLAHLLRERVAFQSGEFHVHSSLLLIRRIAETPAEQEEFGEEGFGAKVRLIEVLPSQEFDSHTFASLAAQKLNPALLSQFNDAKSLASPIAQFLGYFRILESLYHPRSDRRSVKEAFAGSAAFQAVYARIMGRNNFATFVEEIVRVRHQCAHLRRDAGFGYVPVDPEVNSEIRPLCAVLEALSREAILSAA